MPQIFFLKLIYIQHYLDPFDSYGLLTLLSRLGVIMPYFPEEAKYFMILMPFSSFSMVLITFSCPISIIRQMDSNRKLIVLESSEWASISYNNLFSVAESPLKSWVKQRKKSSSLFAPLCPNRCNKISKPAWP